VAKRFDWVPSPVEVVPTFEEYLDATEKERIAAIKEYENLPFARGITEEEELQGYQNHQDEDKLVRGAITYDAAAWSSMAMDYTGGMWAENSAHQKEMANRIMNLWDEDLYEDTILQITDEQESMIETAYSRSPWNIANVFSDQFFEKAVPFVSSFSGDITDLRNDTPSEDWNPDGALELFKLKDTGKYVLYAQKLGGEERMKELIKDAKNPVDFFIILSEAFRTVSIIEATGKFQEENAWYTRWYNHGKHLIINGIINDPDLAPELVAGGLISAGTLGVGSLPYAGLLTLAKLGKGVYTGAKMVDRIAALTRLARRGVSLLPSNIGATAMKKIKGAKYTTAGWAKKHLLYDRLGDMGEGLVTGFLAEVGNQTRKINDGVIDEYDWETIGIETFLETLLSPVINPMIGGSLYGLQRTASIPLGLHVRGETNRTGNVGLGSLYTKMAKWNHPDTIAAAAGELRLNKDYIDKVNSKLDPEFHIKWQDKPSDTVTALEDITGKEFAAYLGMIQQHFKKSPEETMQLALQAMDNITETGLRPLQLAGLIAKSMYDLQIENLKRMGRKVAKKAKRGLLRDEVVDAVLAPEEEVEQNLSKVKESFYELTTVMAHHDMIHQQAINFKDKNGNPTPMTYDSYIKMVQETGQHELLLSEDLRSRTREEHGDNWRSMNGEERYDAAIEIQQQVVQEAIENITKKEDNLAKLEQESNAIGDNLPPEASPVPPPTSTNAAGGVSPEKPSGGPLVTASHTNNTNIARARKEQGLIEKDISERNRAIEKKRQEYREAKDADKPTKHILDQLDDLIVSAREPRGRIKTVRNYLKALESIKNKIKVEQDAMVSILGYDPEIMIIQETLAKLNQEALTIEETLDSKLNELKIVGVRQLQEWADMSGLVTTLFGADINSDNNKLRGKGQILIGDLSHDTKLALHDLRESTRKLNKIRGINDKDSKLIRYIDKIIGKKEIYPVDMALWHTDSEVGKVRTSRQEFKQEVNDRMAKDHSMLRKQQEENGDFEHYSAIAKEIDDLLNKRQRIINSWYISEQQQAQNTLNVLREGRSIIEARHTRLRSIEGRQQAAEVLVQRAKDNPDKPITNRELITLLPRTSKIRQEMEKTRDESADRMEEYLDKPRKIKSVETLLSEEYRRAKSLVRTRTQLGRDPDFRPLPLGHKASHNALNLDDEDYAFLISNGHDTVLQNRKEHLDIGGKVTNVLGDPVKIDKNNNFLKGDDGKPQLIYRTERREYDLEAWDPDKDTELQEVRDKLESIKRQLEISSKKEPKDPWKLPFVRVEDDGARGQRFIDEADGDLVAAQKAYDASDVARIDEDAPRPDNPEWQAAWSKWHEKDQALRDERRGLEYRSSEIHTERQRVKPFEWSTASSEELFFTSSEDVARTYQGQKRGGRVEGVEPEQAYVVIRQPIIIDAGGWNHNALQKDAVLAGLPQRMKDWLKSVDPQQLTMLHHTSETVKNSFESWIKYEIDNGTPGDKLPNAIIYKNIVDPGNLQAGFSREGLTADTVYVRGIEQVVTDLPQPGIIEVKRSPEEEAKAWREIAMNMNAQSAAQGEENGIIAGAVRSGIPKYFRSSDTLGMAEFVFFKEAIVGDFKGVTNNIVLAQNQEVLRYDAGKVAVIATRYQNAIDISELDADIRKRIQMAEEEDLMDPTKPGQAWDAVRTLNLLKELQIAEKPHNVEKFNQHGWILEQDDFAMPIIPTRKPTEQDWITATRRAFKGRLVDNMTGPKIENYAAIYERMGDEATAKQLRDGTKELRNQVLDDVVDKFFDSGIKEINSSWNIRDFGNGNLDWRPATVVAETLADLLSGKPITKGFGIVMAEGMDVIGLDEDTPSGGPSRKVVPPAHGESSRIGVISPSSVIEIVADFKMRARLRAVLSRIKFENGKVTIDLPKRERNQWDKMIDKKSDADLDPTGIEGQIYVYPPLLFGRVQERSATRAMVKEALTYFLREIPNIGISTIQDMEVLAGNYNLTLRSEAPLLGPLSQGGASKVPYNKIGEIYALEMANPAIQGMTDSLIQIVAEEGRAIREEFAAKWPRERVEAKLAQEVDGWDSLSTAKKKIKIDTEAIRMLQRELYNPENYADRLNSGIFEMRLTALAAAHSGKLNEKLQSALENDPAFKSETVKMDDGLGNVKTISIYDAINEYGINAVILQSQYGTEAEYDFYKRTGALVAKALDDPNNQGDPLISQLGDIAKVLRLGKHFDTEITIELGAKDEAIVSALRALYKPPVMRKVYQGGFTNFELEFITDSNGDGVVAIEGLKKAWKDAYGEDLNITEDNIRAFGTVLFKTVLGQTVPLVQQGVGISGTMQKAVQLYMQIDLDSSDFTTINEDMERWNQVLKAKSALRGENAGADLTIEDNDGTQHTVKGEESLPSEAAKGSSFVSISRLTADLEEQVGRIAKKEGIDPSVQRERYADRLNEAHTFMRENGVMIDGELKLKEDRMLELNKLLVPVQGLSAVQIGHLKGMNSMISAGYVINKERITMVARSLGFKTFDIDDLMGLDGLIQYHRFGSTPTVTRGFYTGRPSLNYQGSALGRVATTPKNVEGFLTYEAFMENYIGRIDNPTDKDFIMGTNKFLQAHEDNAKAMGMYDTVDSPYASWTDKQFETHLEKMVYLQEMLWASAHRKSPKFLKNTVDDLSPIAVKDLAMRDWHDTSERTSKSLQAEMDFERTLLSLQEEGIDVQRVVDERTKSRGGLTDEYIERTNAERVVFARTEHDRNSPKRRTNIRTSHTTGPLSLTPKKKQLSWGDRGMAAVQAHMLEDIVREKRGDFDGMREEIKTGHQGMVGLREDGTTDHEGFGWTSVYDDARLPSYPPMYLDPNETYGPGQINQRASRLDPQLREYAREHGAEQGLNEDPTLFIDLYLRSQIQEVLDEYMVYVPRSEEEYRQKRWQWKEKLWKITQVSYEMKYGLTNTQTLFEKSNQISIINPEAGSKEAVLARLINEEFVSQPPIISEALRAGPMDIEGVVLGVSKSDRNNPEIMEMIARGLLEIRQLTANASIPQSKEFNGFVVNQLFQAETAQILKGGWKNSKGVAVGLEKMENANGDVVPIWTVPSVWHVVIDDVGDLQSLRQKVTKELIGPKGTSIDLVLDTTGDIVSESIDPKTGEEIVEVHAKIKYAVRSDLGTQERYYFRNAYAMAGLGFQVRFPRKVIGKEFSVGLTGESMNQLFTQIQNLQTMEDVYQATNTKTKIREVRSETASVNEVTGHSQAPPIQDTKLDSAALLTIMRRQDPNVQVAMVADRTTTGGSQVSEIIDLDHYMRFRRPTMLWKEALVDPLRNVIRRIEFSRVDQKTKDTLKAIQDDVRIFLERDLNFEPTNEEIIRAKLQITYLSQMFAQNTDNIGSRNIEILLPPEMRAKPEMTGHWNDYDDQGVIEGEYADINVNARETAAARWRKLNSELSEKNLQRTNPYYYIMRSGMWHYLNEGVGGFGLRGIITDVARDLRSEIVVPKTIDTKVAELEEAQDFIQLSPDGSVYKNESTGITYQRVSNFITEAEEELPLGPGTDEVLDAKKETAAEVGSNIDTIVRDILSNNLGEWSSYKNENGVLFIKNQITFDRLVKRIQDLEREWHTAGYKIMANNIIVFDDKVKLAGELDILLVNEETGDVRIIDVKTKKNKKYLQNLSKKDRSRYQKQLSLYSILLNNTFGMRPSQIEILPIWVQYPEPIVKKIKKMGKAEVKGVEQEWHTIKEEVEPGKPEASHVHVLEQRHTLEILDDVKGVQFKQDAAEESDAMVQQYRETLPDSLRQRVRDYAALNINFLQYQDDASIWGGEGTLPNGRTTDRNILKNREAVMRRSAEVYAGKDNLTIEANEHAAKTIIENSDEDKSLYTNERVTIAKNNSSKSHKKMDEYADKQPPPMKIDIKRLNNQVSDLVKSGTFDETQAKIARDMILNVYAHNHLMLQDLDLGRWTEPEHAAISTVDEETGKVVYKIRIGDKLRTVAGGKFTALLVLAHELSHIGYMKFIEEGSATWTQFKVLLHNETAKENLKSLVTAWHGGEFTTEAEQEYLSYLENPAEFIAALGSFYLLKGSLPEIKSWATNPSDKSGDGFLRKATELVRSGFAYVRNIFESLASVWGGMSHVREYENLMKSLFGWDLEQNKPLSKTLGVARGKFNFLERFPSNRDQHMSLGEYEVLAIEQLNLEAIENKSEEQAARYFELENELDGNVDGITSDGKKAPGSIIMVGGHTRKDFITNRHKMIGTIDNIGPFGHAFLVHEGDAANPEPGEVVATSTNEASNIHEGLVYILGLDLEKVLFGDKLTLHEPTKLQASIAIQEIFNQLQENFGTQILDKGGELAFKMSKTLSGWLRHLGVTADTEDLNGIRGLLVGGTVGKSGANATWNSPHLLGALMAAMLDDRVVNTSAHYSNVEGVPSVSRTLEQTGLFRDTVFQGMNDIENAIPNSVIRTLLGAGPSKDVGLHIMGDINAQILLKVIDPTHEYEFTEAREVLDKLKPEKTRLVLDSMDNVATQMKKFMEENHKTQRELGEISSINMSMVPIKLTNAINDEDLRVNFNDKVSNLIQERLSNEGGSIDPISLHAANLMPDMRTVALLQQSLQDLKNRYPNWYNMLMAYVEQYHDTDFEQRGLLGGEESNALKHRIRRLQGSAIERLGDSRQQLDLYRNIKDAIQNGFYKQVSKRGDQQISWDAVKAVTPDTPQARTEFTKLIGEYERYRDGRIDPSEKTLVQERLRRLERVGTSDRLPHNIYFQGSGSNKVSLTLDSPAQLHLQNFINRAGQGQYFVNDSWFVPDIQDLIVDSDLRRFFVIHPVNIMNDLHKGHSNEVSERVMLRDNFKVRGTVDQMISVLDRWAEQGGIDNLHTLMGEPSSPHDKKVMRFSIQTIREKHNWMRGIKKMERDYGDMWENTITQIAPGLTKIAFGGNLSLATLVVENTMSTLLELIGRRSLTGAFQNLLAPIRAIPALNTEERKLAAKDLAGVIESLTQIFVPNYESSSLSSESYKVSALINATGDQFMRLPKQFMESIAVTRAISFRKGVTSLMNKGSDGQSKLERLVNYIDTNKLPALEEKGVDLSAAWKRALRESGISVSRDGLIVRHLLNAGLLQPESFMWLKQMIDLEGGFNPHRWGYYSPYEIFTKLSTTMPSVDSNYGELVKVLGDLKFVEKQYIHEAIIDPNTMDIYTGDGRFDKLWEIFRRYPMLFAAQHLFRSASQMPVVGYAMKLLAFAVLDLLYMMLLRIGNGATPEELIEEADEDWVSFAATYIPRLPMWGRWVGTLGEALGSIVSGNYMQQPAGFIGVGAGMSTVRNFFRLGEKIISPDQEVSGEDLVNAMRILPGFGDSLIRQGIYAGWGEHIGDGNRGRGRGRGRGSTSFPSGPTYGLSSKWKNLRYEAFMADLLRELGFQKPWRELENMERRLPFMGDRTLGMDTELDHTTSEMASRAPQDPSQPSQPVQPTPAPSKKDSSPMALLEAQKGKAPEYQEKLVRKLTRRGLPWGPIRKDPRTP
jgi:hypothetical protein